MAIRHTGTRKSSPLPKAATAAVIAHIQEKAPEYACLACRKDDFIVYNHLTAIPAADIATGNFTSEFYPSILTVCSNCGYVMQFVPTGELLAKLTSLATEVADD
jgi:hypothetical protein